LGLEAALVVVSVSGGAIPARATTATSVAASVSTSISTPVSTPIPTPVTHSFPGAFLGFVNPQGPATKLFAIQRANCLVCRRIAHFNETEATGAAGSFIIDQDDFINSAILLEK
jgi:hypothetical protein